MREMSSYAHPRHPTVQKAPTPPPLKAWGAHLRSPCRSVSSPSFCLTDSTVSRSLGGEVWRGGRTGILEGPSPSGRRRLCPLHHYPAPGQGMSLTTCPDGSLSCLCPQTLCEEQRAWLRALWGVFLHRSQGSPAQSLLFKASIPSSPHLLLSF